MKTGLQLKKLFGISKFKYAYIQEIINTPYPIYLITVNTRYPLNPFPLSKMKLSRFNQTKIAKMDGDQIKVKWAKKNLPILLSEWDKSFLAGSLFILQDISGSMYRPAVKFFDPDVRNITSVEDEPTEKPSMATNLMTKILTKAITGGL